MKNRRLIICLAGGLLAGIICLTGGKLSGNINELSFPVTASTIFNRLMLGFCIGVSSLKLNYIYHGMLIGLLVSLISSISFLEDGVIGFIFFNTAGIVYGLLIEVFATKVFKARPELTD